MVGKIAQFPPNLFNTWLEYRESEFGQSRADVIREFNEKLDKKYANSIAYQWKKQRAAVSDSVIKEIIEPELASLYQWYFSSKDYPTDGIDFEALAADFRPPIKNT